MKQNKYVKDWWVEIINENIYTLTFNLTERWLLYHRYDDETYSFGMTDKEVEVNNVIIIPKFLPETKGILYTKCSSMEKNTLTYYFIPINFNDKRKNRNIILEGKNEL